MFYVTLLSMISERIVEIRHNIEKVCAPIGRDPQEISVIAVTKYATVQQMEDLFAAGMTVIGENRVQDAANKFTMLEKKGLVFKRHMIGHLQTNKVKEAVRLFDMIQSVDSMKVAQEIDKQAAAQGKVMEILVQVNSSREPQKSGVRLEEAMQLLEEISDLTHVRGLGLMTIGLLSDDRKKVAECFQLTKGLFDQARAAFAASRHIEMKYLSMGMTQDYDLAILHGANMVRIGSAIFA